MLIILYINAFGNCRYVSCAVAPYLPAVLVAVAVGSLSFDTLGVVGVS